MFDILSEIYRPQNLSKGFDQPSFLSRKTFSVIVCVCIDPVAVFAIARYTKNHYMFFLF